MIEAVLAQTGRDLQRFDVDFDIPDILLPEFPPAIFLTTRPDLGDVSNGLVLTTDNYFELFTRCTANGCDPILNPKQLDGLRLLLTPFAQQQFNLIDDRRTLRPTLGIACLDCHVNGHTNAGTHTVGDIRPQAFRHRIDSPTLRGVNIQQLFGSQRSLHSVEDFTEFEQRAAYFDGDPVSATKKGVNFLDRGGQVHEMAEFQELLNFPPAPKLDEFGRLIPGLASPAELRGEVVFNGKGRCVSCHPPPFFTDNLSHDLMVERFYTTRTIAGMVATADGPIKTFPLRGIKDSPPYFHDDRLMTLADTIEFFNLVLGVQLLASEKSDLLAFLLTL
jgi:cytochrome c peroxidase